MSIGEYQKSRGHYPYLEKWEGDDGPERYGRECRDLEKKLERILRPDSLGPAEEDVGALDCGRVSRSKSREDKSAEDQNSKKRMREL